jgi:hypothetical protein
LRLADYLDYSTASWMLLTPPKAKFTVEKNREKKWQGS